MPRAFPPALRTFATVAILACLAGTASAQGLLIISIPGPEPAPVYRVRMPRPIPQPQPSPASYRIASLEINATLRDSVAEVQVAQTFENTGSGNIEASFIFPLPYDGAVDQLTLMVDGKEYEAKLRSAKEARERFEAIVRQSRDPALLEWVGNGMFQTSVFPIPPGAKRTVTLRYTQLCRKSNGLTDFLFPLSTAKFTSAELDKLAIRVAVESKTDIKTIYSPTHAISIERPDDKHAVVKYEQKKTVPTDDFRLFTSSEQGDVAASVVSYRPDKSEDGYFMLLASPQITQPEGKRQAKTVVVVVDRSGSMSGEKMDQAREAAKFVLNNLHEGDTFNIVAYDSDVETFRPELEKFNDETRLAATGFINGLFAGGTTNIDGALSRALDMLKDSKRPAYVIFLTDGLPTYGETNETKIVEHAAAANKVRARVFTFGVGYDLNSRLLDKLARAAHGTTEFVRPKENIEAAVSSLYRRIGAPVMTDVTLKVDVEGASVADGATTNRVYPDGPFDLFAGDQAVLVGRFRTSGAAKVTLKGKVGDAEQSLVFPADLTAKSSDDTNSFVAKLWATRRVGEIIDEIDLHGRNEELVKELVDLATKHGILTPYTSFLADESSNIRDLSSLNRSAGEQLGQLAVTDGESGVRQRAAKSAMRGASAPGFGGGGFGGGGGGFGRGGGDRFADSSSISGGVAGSAPAAVAEPALEAESQAQLAATGGRGIAYYDAKEDKTKVTGNAISVGRKTFFRRGQRWVDSTITAEEEKAAKNIERFSDDYFALVDLFGQYVAAYLTIEDPVTIKLDGQVYTW